MEHLQDTHPLLPQPSGVSSSAHDKANYYLASSRRACYYAAVAGYVLYGLQMVVAYINCIFMACTLRDVPFILYVNHFVPSISLLPVAVCLHLVWLLPLVGADGVYFLASWPALQALKRRGLAVLLVTLVSAILVTPWFVVIQPFLWFPKGDGILGPGFDVYFTLLVYYSPFVYPYFVAVLGLSAFLLYWCDKGMVLLAEEAAYVNAVSAV